MKSLLIAVVGMFALGTAPTEECLLFKKALLFGALKGGYHRGYHGGYNGGYNGGHGGYYGNHYHAKGCYGY